MAQMEWMWMGSVLYYLYRLACTLGIHHVFLMRAYFMLATLY